MQVLTPWRRSCRHRRIHWALAGALLSFSLYSCGSLHSGNPTGVSATNAPIPKLGPTATPRPPTPTGVAASPTPTLMPLAPVTGMDRIRGPIDAPASIVAYMDFQSPACARLAVILAEIQRDHPEDVSLIYRPLPVLPVHDKAALAGQAAEAAGAQDAFWSMYDRLFEEHDEWIDRSPAEFEVWLVAQATELGLDAARFQDDLKSPEIVNRLAQAYINGAASGIPSVPFVFLNGELYRLALDHPNLEASVGLAVLQKSQFESYPAQVIDLDRDYSARLQLNIGEVVLQLFPRSAPLAVNSFVFLAEQGWYDGSPVFRVNPGRLVETGDPSGTGIGDAGYHFETELDPSLAFDRAGIVGLSNNGPGTNSSRFFITLAPLPAFDGSLTIFGRVVSGLELLDVLDQRDPLENSLDRPQAVLMKVVIEVE